MENKPRVLVTGARGFVGRHVAEYLQTAGWQVVGVDLRGEISIDISSAGFVREMLDSVQICEAIVHVAAVKNKDPDDPSLSLVNCLGTQQVLVLARKWKVRNLVYLSGAHAVGRPTVPIITEEHSVHPINAYHASKIYGEHLVAILGSEGCKAATLRMSSPIGPLTPPDTIFSVFVKLATQGKNLVLAGHGSRQQDYIDVRDAARAIGVCLEKDASGVFNLCAGRPVSNRELAEECIGTLGSKSTIGYSGVSDPEEGVIWRFSRDRLAALGWKPIHSLADSIRAWVGADFQRSKS
ncbi:MAG: NAD(P)-dependent oxidoreductase [Planctomycetota bacterium]|mgnify:CR=1 FL=1